MRKRAQFSLDLMIVTAIMLVLFLSLFQYYIGKAEGSQLTREKVSATAISQALAGRIDNVLSAGNGTVAIFPLPETLDGGRAYSINVGNRRVEISFGSSTVSSLISTSKTSSGNLNSKKGSQVRISNIYDEIYLE